MSMKDKGRIKESIIKVMESDMEKLGHTKLKDIRKLIPSQEMMDAESSKVFVKKPTPKQKITSHFKRQLNAFISSRFQRINMPMPTASASGAIKGIKTALK